MTVTMPTQAPERIRDAELHAALTVARHALQRAATRTHQLKGTRTSLARFLDRATDLIERMQTATLP